MLDKETEKKLAECINDMYNLGFSPCTSEILELVSEYVAKNKIVVPLFKDGKPGRFLLAAFMKRNNFSLKNQYGQKISNRKPFRNI